MSRNCEWIGPDQDPMKGPVGYCGKTTVEGRNYCELHLWQVYQPGTALRPRKKDQARIDRKRELQDLISSIAEELDL